MPSGGATRATDRQSSTSSTSRSTSTLARSTGISAVRICRWTSARTCHICQVERDSSITARTWSAVFATQRASAIVAVSAAGVSAVLHHRRDRVTSAQHCCGFVQPGGALLGQGSGFVFGVAGFQGGLLRQLHCFDRCRRPAMIMLELDRQLALAGVDVGPAGGPALVQRGSTPTISRIGRLTGSVSGRSANRTPSLSRR